MNRLQYPMVIIAFSSAATFANADTKEETPLPDIEYSEKFFTKVCDRLKDVFKHNPDNRIPLGQPIKDILANHSPFVTVRGYESHNYHFLENSAEGYDPYYILADEPNTTVCHISEDTYDYYKPKP